MSFRTFLIAILTVTLVLSVAIMAFAYRVVTSAGLIVLDVVDRHERAAIRFGVPAVFANAVLGAVDVGTVCHDPEVRPILRAASRELSNLPDMTLVEVIGHNDEHVRIRSVSRTIVIEVESPDADVRIKVPQSTVRRLSL
jgi:hypothetical protein